MTLNNYSKISSLHREQKTAERQADARALADWNLNVLLDDARRNLTGRDLEDVTTVLRACLARNAAQAEPTELTP